MLDQEKKNSEWNINVYQHPVKHETERITSVL